MNKKDYGEMLSMIGVMIFLLLMILSFFNNLMYDFYLFAFLTIFSLACFIMINRKNEIKGNCINEDDVDDDKEIEN